MLGGAPEAHEVLSKTPRVRIISLRSILSEPFPIKASDDLEVIAPWFEPNWNAHPPKRSSKLGGFRGPRLANDLSKAYVVQISFKTLAKFAPTIFSATRVG